MIKYQTACEQVGYDKTVSCPIEPVYTWFAYSGGVSKEFKSAEEAKKYSRMFEKVVKNKAEIEAWWDGRKALETQARDVWYAALREEFIDGEFISEALFDICFSEAYDRGHHAGCDEIYCYMGATVSFAKRVLEANVS